MRGGKYDLGIHANFCSNLVPVFDDGIGTVDDCAIHIKELNRVSAC